MTTFRSRIIQCASCKLKMYTLELTPFTVHSSVVYSDGLVENNPPTLLNQKILVCHDCYKPIWREDVFVDDSGDSYDELPQAHDIYDLPFAFDSDFSNKLVGYYNNLLEEGFADSLQREIYIRINIWQLLNNSKRNKVDTNVYDKIRSNIKGVIGNTKSAFTIETDKDNNDLIFRNNLEKLINIYNPSCDAEQLLLAEMYRELGNFEEAELQLIKVDNKVSSSVYKQIKKLNNNKKTKVTLLT
ncbi:MAG: hypothetical protein QM503_01135 [Bacteroidota bacterium]